MRIVLTETKHRITVRTSLTPQEVAKRIKGDRSFDRIPEDERFQHFLIVKKAKVE
jgi:hypothetical protein